MSVRAYNQVARAKATEQTRQAIIDAAVELFYLGEYEAELERIATRAGVTTRTVLRHFGSRDGLTEAAIASQARAVQAKRAARPGDARAFVVALVDHYEAEGDRVLRTLAVEDRYPTVHRAVEDGRRLHAKLVSEAFAADLEPLASAARARLLGVLVAVTDVHMWALLRRRAGLDRKSTEAEILGLVNYARGEER
jgi:AcrR family transcriptional regulator